MKMRLTLPCVVLILAFQCSSTVVAQSSGNTGGTGSTGTTGSTGSANGLLTSQLSAGLTSTTSGLTSQTSGSTGSTSQSPTGSSTGTTGNTGNAAQTFIGGNATENFVGGAREATTQQSMNRQFIQFLADSTNSTSQTQQSGTPREIRTVMSIGFSFPTASAAQQSGKLAAPNSLTLARFTSTRPEFAGVSVELTSKGEAILTGSLPSTESSRLAANLIRLQPGVRKVNNQIAVTR